MTDPADRRFVPPHPPRLPGPVPVWRGLFGERARTAVHGWSQRAFETWSIERNVLGIRVHIPLHPDAVQRVLLDNAANYEKPRLVKGLLAPTIGRGLLMADGALWREQRRIAASSFAPLAVDALLPIFHHVAQVRAATWSDGRADMAQESTVTTMTVIADALFGGDARLKTPAALAHITAAMEGVTQARLPTLLGLPILPLTQKLRAGRECQKFLRSTLAAVVRQRLPDGGPDDFLGRLIRDLLARFPIAEAFDLAVDNATTFYLAGHETTANALSWSLYLLSEQPNLQEQAAAEAEAALGSGDDLPPQVPLLRAVLEEALRLYPPVPRMDREALAADQLGEAQVSPGDIVSIWPWLLHRHSRLWEDPDAFCPTRFAAGANRPHRYQYLPFGAGPRVCVGARFATVEALTVLACWLAEWRFRPAPGHQVRASGMVTLRPADGLPLIRNRR